MDPPHRVGGAPVQAAWKAAASSLRSRRGLPTIVDTGAGRSSIERSRPRMRRGLPSSGADSKVSCAASAAIGALFMVWLFSLAGMGKANASGRLYKDDARLAVWMTVCGPAHRIFPWTSDVQPAQTG